MEVKNSVKYSCGIITNIAPLYTKPLWLELIKSAAVDYSFYSDKKGFSGIETIDVLESSNISKEGKFNWQFLKNKYYKNIVIFQQGMFSLCYTKGFDACIFGGEMYNVSNWIGAVICKLRGIKVIFWGHGLYGNEGLLKRIFRRLFNSLASCHLLYGNYAARLLAASGTPESRIFVCYNSLDFKTQFDIYIKRNSSELIHLKSQLFPDNPDLPVLIFLGRLTKSKKIAMLIEAMNICRQRGNNYNCLIVGDGSDIEFLKDYSNRMNLSRHIVFYGSCYDENINSRLIMMSDCCVSPGSTGLTAIHSLSLGTPVITHSNMAHQGPEVEAVIHGVTGFLFDEGNVSALSDAIDCMLCSNKKALMEMNCIEQVKRVWNPVYQASVFDRAVLFSLNS